MKRNVVRISSKFVVELRLRADEFQIPPHRQAVSLAAINSLRQVTPRIIIVNRIRNMKGKLVEHLSKKDIQILNDIRKKVKEKDKKCFTNGCLQTAINSHLLQQNGVLNNISRNGHIIQMTSGRYFNETVFRFQKRSIAKSEVLTYKGFCAECDHKIFKPIEIPSTNFSDYRNQLLFAYRAFLSEYREALDLIDIHNLIIENRSLSSEVKAMVSPMRNRSAWAAQFFQYHLTVIERELFHPQSLFKDLFLKRHYRFHSFSLPKLEIASSAIFSYPLTFNVTKSEYNYLRTLSDKKLKSMKAIFLTLIPKAQNSTLIIGYMKGLRYIEGIAVKNLINLDNAELLKLLSDLLVKRVDSWCMSLPYYEELKKTDKDKRIVEIKNHLFVRPEYLNIQSMLDSGIECNLFNDQVR